MEPVGGTAITSVDFDFDGNAIFFADTSGPNRGIHRLALGQSTFTPIVKDNVANFVVKSIAVDWINCAYSSFDFLDHMSHSDNLYFINVDSDRSHIEVSRLDGQYRKVLMATRTETPTSIAVDPVSRYIFWSDQGQKPNIQVRNNKLDRDCRLSGQNWTARISA